MNDRGFGLRLKSTSVAPSISDLIWVLISSDIFARVDHPLAPVMAHCDSLDKAMSDWWMVWQGFSNFNDAVAEIYTDFYELHVWIYRGNLACIAYDMGCG